jgi:hypothetical protein
VTVTPRRSASIRSAAFCAVVKSTYSPVSPPVKEICSICANHCPRSSAEPSSSSNAASSTRRSSSVSLTSNAMTFVMGPPSGGRGRSLLGLPREAAADPSPKECADRLWS